MRIKMKKTKHGKLSLMKNKIVKRNSELYKKVKEKKLKSKRTCIKFEIQTNWGAAMKIWKARCEN